MIAQPAGELRHQVTLQHATATLDSFGQQSLAWSNIGTYWASVRPLNGRELVNAQQVKANVSHAVTLRYGPTINVKDRFQFRGRTLEAAAVLDDSEQQCRLLVYCTEVV